MPGTEGTKCASESRFAWPKLSYRKSQDVQSFAPTILNRDSAMNFLIRRRRLSRFSRIVVWQFLEARP